MTLSLPWPRRRADAGRVASSPRARAGVRLRSGDTTTALLGLAVYLGFLVRLQHVLGAHGFPLNDGGLFYAMIEDVRHAGYALPAYTSYNGGDIPFAYSPLPFYLGAFLRDVFGVSTLDVLRFLPLVLSTATIPAAYLLGRALLPKRSMALLATFIFALTPRAFSWEISGGGLTRSLGLLFFILALHQLYRLTREPSPRRTAVATLLVSLTLLSHMEMGWLLACSYALVLAFYGRSRAPLVCAAFVGGGALLLTAPWWSQVVAQHDIEPYLNAAQSGKQGVLVPLRLLLFDYTDEPFLPVVAALGALGLVVSLATRQYFLPVWLVVIFTLDPRKAPTYAMLPMAMLAAYVVQDVLRPQLERLATLSAVGAGERRSRLAAALPALVVVYLMVSSPGASQLRLSPLHALEPADVQAMRWLEDNVPRESRFLVMNGLAPQPWLDLRSEWLPALTGRVSLATVQGSEWLPGGRGMQASIERYEELQLCADETSGCLDAWAADGGVAYTHVVVPRSPASERKRDTAIRPLPERDCCAALRASLAGSSAYELVYEGETVQVFALRSAAAGASSERAANEARLR